MMTRGVLFWLVMSRSDTGKVMICFFTRAIVISGLSSVNLMREVSFPLTKTLCKITQGKIGESICSGMSLYLVNFSRVWLKSILMTLISRSKASDMAID